jgi:hypothetical protein
MGEQGVDGAYRCVGSEHDAHRGCGRAHRIHVRDGAEFAVRRTQRIEAEQRQAETLHHDGRGEPAHGARCAARRQAGLESASGRARGRLGGFDTRPELVEGALLVAGDRRRRLARDAHLAGQLALRVELGAAFRAALHVRLHPLAV